MDQEEYIEIWESLLVKRGLGKFKRVDMEGTPYLRTNYRINEPDDRQRIERWVVTSKELVSLSDIAKFNRFVEKTGYDRGIMLTQSTLTGSALWLLKGTPHVRVYDRRVFAKLVSAEPEIAAEYGVQIEESLPPEVKELLERLEKCSPGKKLWSDYEDLINDILCYVFIPPLSPPRPQSRAEDGLVVRDLIFPNHAHSGFWLNVKSEYKGSYIVIEAKNKTDPAKKDVTQLSEYLHEKQLGLFGILIARNFSQSAIDQRRAAYFHEPHRMIVLVDDGDIKEMIIKKSRREKPEEVLRDRIDLYRISYRF